MTLSDAAAALNPPFNRGDLEGETDWLRYRLIRMRTGFRFARGPEVEAILREFVGEGEERLAKLEFRDRLWRQTEAAAVLDDNAPLLGVLG